MLILTMISLLIGAALGLRFKVFILVPVIGLALAMVAVNGAGDGTWQLVVTMVVVATFLQLGYLGGSILQSAVCAGRAADQRASTPTSTEIPSGQLRTGQLRNRAGASSRFEASKQLRQA
jgi:hypothetical protein